MNTISFVTANFVARYTGYNMTGGWDHGSTTTSDYFRPIETFPERFDALMAEIRGLGFSAVDLWMNHLHFDWATDRHIEAARESLGRHGLSVTAFVGYGHTEKEIHAIGRLVQGMGCKMWSGSLGLLVSDRTRLPDILRHYDFRLAVENHPEKNAAELLARLGEGDEDVIGACADTGWFGTQDCNAADAIHELKGRLFHIHLKDVKARRAGKTGYEGIDLGHECCRYGAGIVPVEQTVRTAIRDGFKGPISVEQEPELYDPTEDVRASLQLLKSWI